MSRTERHPQRGGSDAFGGVEREPLLDTSGRPVLYFLRTTRDGLPAADLVVPAEGVSDERVAAAARNAFAGWAVSASPPVARLLLALGGTVMRHAHVMSRDLVADPAEVAWADEQPKAAHLSVATAPSEPRAYLELQEAAYPAGHPDHVLRSEDDRLAHDIVPLLDGTLGPVLDASRVVVERDGGRGAGRVVAACVVNEREPDGPWVTDVCRMPGAAYRGLGSLLLRRALAKLTSEQRPTLGLAVTHGNTARKTYDRLGFVEVLESLTVKLPGAPAPR